MGKILSSTLDYIIKILIITFVNFIIASIACLSKSQFTLFNLGHGLFIGGLVMSVIGCLSAIGAGKVTQIDGQNTYITGYNEDSFWKNYIKSRNQNMNFTALLILSGAFSIFIGYVLQQ